MTSLSLILFLFAIVVGGSPAATSAELKPQRALAKSPGRQNARGFLS